MLSGANCSLQHAQMSWLGAQGGVILIVIVVFMAVTSSGSAELVAVSSLVSYDVYRTYINPKATGQQVPASLWGPIKA